MNKKTLYTYIVIGIVVGLVIVILLRYLFNFYGDDMLQNLIAEIIGITFTVLVIERIINHQWRDTEKRLSSQVYSINNGLKLLFITLMRSKRIRRELPEEYLRSYEEIQKDYVSNINGLLKNHLHLLSIKEWSSFAKLAKHNIPQLRDLLSTYIQLRTEPTTIEYLNSLINSLQNMINFIVLMEVAFESNEQEFSEEDESDEKEILTTVNEMIKAIFHIIFQYEKSN
jgi:hypothetical protein